MQKLFMTLCNYVSNRTTGHTAGLGDIFEC